MKKETWVPADVDVDVDVNVDDDVVEDDDGDEDDAECDKVIGKSNKGEPGRTRHGISGQSGQVAAFKHSNQFLTNDGDAQT